MSTTSSGQETTAARAYRQATEALGMAGDPHTHWAIALDFEFTERLDLSDVDTRMAAMVRAYPHIGVAPRLQSCSLDDWTQRRHRLVTAPFSPEEPLVRLLTDEGARRLLVVAHHGVCDGLGLVALAREVSGVDLRTRAGGVGARARDKSFLAGSLVRLFEALVRPPLRFAGTRSDAEGDHLRTLILPRSPVRSGALAWAVGRTHRDWSDRRGIKERLGRLVVLAGASRREPGDFGPDRRTALLRFVLDPHWSARTAQERFASVDPEPDFPETSAGGIGPLVTRLLRNRLGGTALISNLGIIEGPGLERVTLVPHVSGPSAVSIAVVSTQRWTVFLIHTRASEFTATETDRLLEGVRRHAVPAPTDAEPDEGSPAAQ